MTSLPNGVLFGETFGTREMRAVFDEDAFVERFLEVEAALARAEAEAGVIPAEAAERISETATPEHLDAERVAENVEDMGLFSMAIVEAWRADLGADGEYLHWGASTQDVSDTVLVLQLREAHGIVLRDLRAIRDRLAELAAEYRDAPILGRTQYMAGPPITFGFKTATWADEIDRHCRRLEELAERTFVVQLAGASGSLAPLEEVGPGIVEAFADELGLDAPRIGWTASRDRFAELTNVFAMVAATLARTSRELLFLNRPEIDEVDEAIPEGELGSSTNPHKRNPVYSQLTVGLARLVRGNAAVMNELAEPAGDRDRSTWYVEFAVLPETCIYLARMLANAKRNLEGLSVDPAAMERTVREAGSLVASEAVMIALAEHVGRQTAHEIVHDAAMRAIEEEIDFARCLREDERVTAYLPAERIDALTDPTAYTGLSASLVDDVLGSLEDGSSGR